jgi:WhiB family redox-sensing transcriptional regulator
MTLRHFGILSSEYIQLLALIRSQPSKLPCEWKPEYWFPEDIADPIVRTKATTLALTGCRSCPIAEQCFTYALENNERHGIWGGSLPSERI